MLTSVIGLMIHLLSRLRGNLIPCALRAPEAQVLARTYGRAIDGYQAVGRPARTRGPQQRPAPASKRLALLVGINDYTSGIPDAARLKARWHDLRGAVHDAESMRDLLIEEHGFTTDSILLLTDRTATRRAILDGLERHLLASAKRDDELVFYYAGHGSQVPNPASEERDKLDESLVPADSNQGAPDIRDKELARLFNRILDTGARLTIVFDNCHSGGAARGLPAAALARSLPPSTRGVNDPMPTGAKPEDRGALILSATQDFEPAYETYDEAGQDRGAFSWALLAALGRSLPGESAEATFLRARALLQTRENRQQPVLIGLPERMNRPLFGAGGGRHERLSMVAVERVKTGGGVVLQGGWVHGLRAGVELEALAAKDGTAPPPLEVTRILGPARAEARLLPVRQGARPPRPVAPGDLFSVSRWAISNEPSLRVWVADAGPQWPRLLAWAEQLQELVRSQSVRWVADPVESTPTHVLDWHGGWWLTVCGGRSEPLGPEPAPGEVLRRIKAEAEKPALFVHLPAPPELAHGLVLGQATSNNVVERSAGPAGAHYQLVGRLAGGEVSFAWVRPAVGRIDAAAAQLPLRTDWCRGLKGCASALTDKALRLAKIRAWLTIESPLGGEFPYRFALLSESGEAKRGGTLQALERLGLVLRASHEALATARAQRYLYFFTLDSFGNSTLLFPRRSQGTVENRFPVLARPEDPWPAEFQVGTREMFRIREPFGLDTYFLLSTEVPIPNPWVVQFPGVRSRGPTGSTLLEELLSQTGASRRTVKPMTGLPIDWSLERLTFETVPAASGAAER